MDMQTYKLPDGKVLGLRTCKADMSSHNGFVWPREGYAEAPDWTPTEECGNGLHALIKGVGYVDLLSSEDDAVWMVVEIDTDKVIDLSGKGKFPNCNVLYAGDKPTACNFVKFIYPGEAVVYATATAGYGGTATAGYGGTATAGTRGTATAGTRGTATAGDGGTATAGDGGTATAGTRGTATAGTRGTATAGTRGTATAGDGGTATAGDEGMILIRRWNGKCYKYEMANVGENDIKPNVAYRLNDDGAFVEA